MQTTTQEGQQEEEAPLSPVRLAQAGVLWLLRGGAWRPDYEIEEALLGRFTITNHDLRLALAGLLVKKLIERARYQGLGGSAYRLAPDAEEEELRERIGAPPESRQQRTWAALEKEINAFLARRERAAQESDSWRWSGRWPGMDTQVTTPGGTYTFDEAGRCSCPDSLHRGGLCKHMCQREARRRARLADFGS